jgi:hypothetical protein
MSTTNKETTVSQIAAVLASTDPSLGLTDAQAADLKDQDQIIQSDACDDDSMRAYDLLAARLTFGRAF